jgi:hypothetical protein
MLRWIKEVRRFVRESLDALVADEYDKERQARAARDRERAFHRWLYS